jgi:hypothetical protein
MGRFLGAPGNRSRTAQRLSQIAKRVDRPHVRKRCTENLAFAVCDFWRPICASTNVPRMAKDLIGYEALTDRALRSVVKEALKRVQKQGLPGNHHFYLTFKTHDPGVEIPEFLKDRYPDEMTIVLQNQYSGLDVGEEGFEVTLGFQKLPATLAIPFAALTGFVDPAVQFGLQFKNATASQNAGGAGIRESPQGAHSQSAAPASSHDAQPEAPAEKSQVVSLDKFRKK